MTLHVYLHSILSSSKVQARKLFSAYLECVQRRLAEEARCVNYSHSLLVHVLCVYTNMVCTDLCYMRCTSSLFCSVVDVRNQPAADRAVGPLLSVMSYVHGKFIYL